MASSLDWTSLPKEMWIEIWSNLDFHTLQKICTLVSKDWKKYIRGSTRLSSEGIYLNLDSRRDTLPNGFELLKEVDINAVLASWPKLKTLHVSNLDSISRHGIHLIENDDSHTSSLEKIIVAPKPGQQIRGCIPCIQGVCEIEWGECTDPDFARTFAWLTSSKRYLNENQINGNDNQMDNDGNSGFRNSFLQVEKFWLDPKNIMSPIKIENVLGIHLEPPGNDVFDVYLKKIRPMTIETLSFNPLRLDKPWNFDWILNFKNLKKLTIMGELNPLDVDLSYMLDVLKKIHGMKMIVFESWELKKEFFGQFLKQFPPGQTLVIQGNCCFSFQITSLLEILNSLGEMKDKKILQIYNIEWYGYGVNLQKEETKEILKKAQEIINEKFDELEYIYLREGKYGFKLLKEKGKVWQMTVSP